MTPQRIRPALLIPDEPDDFRRNRPVTDGERLTHGYLQYKLAVKSQDLLTQVERARRREAREERYLWWAFWLSVGCATVAVFSWGVWWWG
jgi:hypothetical protein